MHNAISPTGPKNTISYNANSFCSFSDFNSSIILSARSSVTVFSLSLIYTSCTSNIQLSKITLANHSWNGIAANPNVHTIAIHQIAIGPK